MAISIVALLIGIGAVVANRATVEARKEQTRAMMNGLLAANDEYKAIRGAGISVNSSSADSSTTQFVTACLTVKSCEEIMMSAINSSTSSALERTFINGTIFDRWGTEIEYRSKNDGGAGAGPSTGVLDSELPISRDPFFVSAGPDEDFGTEDDITTLQN